MLFTHTDLPLPVLPAGVSCQNTSQGPVPVAQEAMPAYIDEVLHLIEFCNGSTATEWGAKRAAMGHPEPFGLEYLGIGNEDLIDDVFKNRFQQIFDAVKAAYPDIVVVGTVGPAPSGQDYEEGWKYAREAGLPIVDEHSYQSSSWWFHNLDHYDHTDRKGPKVYAGEYASHHKSRANNFETALSEAAFLTGVERNADVVRLATYAPLLAHVDAWQWRPDMIWFDNSRVLLTPNYYVQQLYSRYKGTHTLRLTEEGEAVKGTDGLYASAVSDADSSRLIVKVANTASRRQEVVLQFEGLKRRQALSPEVSVVVMQSDDKNAVNTFENPEAVVPQRATAVVEGNSCRYTLAPQSFQVIIIPIVSKQ